ncbi:MAG TPA: hypothetical protein VD907_05605 [Verrucomicrobiae bacterium]|nr:hypothetical protein [Verrucomicrobiae bacterium]
MSFSLRTLGKFKPAASMGYAPKWLREVAAGNSASPDLNPFLPELSPSDLTNWFGRMHTAWQSAGEVALAPVMRHESAYLLLGYLHEQRHYLASIALFVDPLFSNDVPKNGAIVLEAHARLFSFISLDANSKEKPGSEQWWAATLQRPRSSWLPQLQSTKTHNGNDNLRLHQPQVMKCQRLTINSRGQVALS